MTYNQKQKDAIANFVVVTKSDTKTAEKILPTFDWVLKRALDAYFYNPSAYNLRTSKTAVLNDLFDKYKDGPDSISINAAPKYLSDIGVSLDEIALLGILALLQSPSLGEFTREGFVNGWRSIHYTTIEKQKEYVVELRHRLSSDPTVFRTTYRHTFMIARSVGQKSIPLDTAVTYWQLLFGLQGRNWGVGGGSNKSIKYPWLDWWIEYVNTEWKRAVGRDMWNMTEVFAQKTEEDESLSWWSEDGAWPGVIDEFVGWIRTHVDMEEQKQEEKDDGKMDIT